MAEFSGERVVPGKVDIDLWNEHLSRYLFAARLCRFKKVLDMGCGTGYGSAELARVADSVVGVDVSEDAVLEASVEYERANLSFEVASLEKLPFADGMFNVGVCFEVIEHLEDFRAMLREARRVIAHNGQFVVSTPNKLYYAESRKKDGPNPFHVHEFTFEEFKETLSEFFPHQTYFVQNHASGLVFLPLEGQAGVELRLESEGTKAEDAHFFLAVCAAKPLMGAPSFVYVPTSANVLRERELHIARLEGELGQKDEWLEKAKNEHAAVVEQFRGLQAEMEKKNRWALEQDERVKKAAKEVERLDKELAAQNEEAQTMAAAYEGQMRELEKASAANVKWAQDTEKRLEGEKQQLATHVKKLDEEMKKAAAQLSEYQKKLDEVEKTVIERTEWAQREQALREEMEGKVAAVESSRWMKVGRRFGLGPRIG